jgi:hypothetical protein
VPVLALAGEREPEAVFHAGVRRARSASVDVIDLVSDRAIDSGEFDILAVPGYPDSATGCGYSKKDLTLVRDLARQRNRPLILLTHMPPRGDGPSAVDWEQGQNGGDPALLDLINAVYPNVALFAHADDAGGHVQRTWMNVGGVARGMATIVDMVDRLPQQHVITVGGLEKN